MIDYIKFFTLSVYLRKVCFSRYSAFLHRGAVVTVIAWQLDLQLPMQSVPITTDVVSLNLNQGEEYNIM